MNVLKIFRLFKLFRLVRMMRVKVDTGFSSTNKGAVRLGKITAALMLLLHFIACGYWLSVEKVTGFGTDGIYSWAPDIKWKTEGWVGKYSQVVKFESSISSKSLTSISGFLLGY